MKKIGLFLEAVPFSGGTFQYNISMLEAVHSLPKTEFEIVIGYTGVGWFKYLEGYNEPAVHMPFGLWEGITGAGWRLSNLPMGLWRNICPYFHRLVMAIVKQNCDLWVFPSQDRWSYMIPVPALGTVHDLMHRYEGHFPEVSVKGEYKRREYLYSNMCRWSEGVIVDSLVGKNQVQESYGIPAERVHILPFVPPKYIYETKTPSDLRQRYSLPDKFIFYPAHFWQHKNHEILIRAAARLKKQIPDINMVFAGSKKNGYEPAMLLARELGVSENIHVLDYIPDEYMTGIYHLARAMVMPTFFGPTNIPPLEAFATGCPAAVSGIYGMPEQVGDAALLFNPKSLDDISDVILKLWNDDKLCIELRARGFEKAREWGQTQFNNRFAEIIRAVLEK